MSAMNDYLLLIFNDAEDPPLADDAERWSTYLAGLRQSGQFEGGSSIGRGERLKRGQAAQAAGGELAGFLRLRAESPAQARRFLEGNPAYEAGATIEILELPRD